MRFSRFFSKFSKNIFSIELFPSREQTEQKKNQLNMSSVTIESAYKKIIIFEVCPNFPTFLCNSPDFFLTKGTLNFKKLKILS
jgi:hypothetical protein